jgi:cardiolipin synthase (CMP-forming)
MRHIPNALCILRMLLVLPVAWLLIHGDFGGTLWVFGLAAITDGLDGFLAKRCGWTSELGKILDPLADKILLVSVFLLLAFLGLLPIWLTAVAVARDVVITAGAIAYNHLYGYPNGRPTPVSKLNTVSQLLYLLLVVAEHDAQIRLEPLEIILGAMVFVFTVVSGLDYVLTYSRKAIHASRQQRELAQ